VGGVKKVQFVGGSISCIVLRGCCYNTIVLNVHAPSEEKSDYSKDRFCEDLQHFSIIFLSTI